MRFVHEFKEFVHHGFEELPMRFEESRVLADDIHNIRGDNRLVVLPSFDLAQAKKILDDCDQESLFCLLIYEYHASVYEEKKVKLMGTYSLHLISNQWPSIMY